MSWPTGSEERWAEQRYCQRVPSLSPGVAPAVSSCVSTHCSGVPGCLWEAGGVLLPACSYWDHETKVTLGMYLYPLLAPVEEKSAAANGQCVTDQGGCQSRLWKSDFLLHFSAGEKVTTLPFRIVSLTLCAGCSDAGRWEGKEPGPPHPSAQNHEEMLNWHLELSVVAGLGGQTLLHPVWTTQSFL